jgi:hypothetical protein
VFIDGELTPRCTLNARPFICLVDLTAASGAIALEEDERHKQRGREARDSTSRRHDAIRRETLR